MIRTFITLFIALQFNAAAALSPEPVPYDPMPTSPIQFAELVSFDINHDFLGQSEMGNIEINHNEMDITLSLFEPVSCDPEMACTMVMIDHVVKLPLTSIETGSCGETIYTAVRDQRPADGLYQKIEVVDYSTMHCEIALQYLTGISYMTHHPFGGVATISTFNANTLISPTNF